MAARELREWRKGEEGEDAGDDTWRSITREQRDRLIALLDEPDTHPPRREPLLSESLWALITS